MPSGYNEGETAETSTIQTKCIQRFRKMMRKSLNQIRYYAKEYNLLRHYNFVHAKYHHVNDIIDMCTSEFIHEEPHSRALNITPESSRSLFEYITAKSIHYPYSYVVYDKELNKLIGFRLLSVGNRDHSLDVEPVPFVVPEDAGMRTLCEILDECKAKLWTWADNSIQKVIRREITYITPRHQKKGIANYLLHLGLDFSVLKKEGFHGITSEASSLANQKLLAKNGYICVAKLNHNLQLHDGNHGVKVYFKDLRD